MTPSDRSHRADRTERGAGTVLAVALAAVLLTLGVALAACVGIVHAQRQAQAAADLAALAGAVAADRGGDGCAAASEVAALNEARLVSCTPEGTRVWVRAGVLGPSWAGFGGEIVGEAVAGPR